MALNNFKCNHLMPLHYKGLIISVNTTSYDQLTLIVHQSETHLEKRAQRQPWPDRTHFIQTKVRQAVLACTSWRRQIAEILCIQQSLLICFLCNGEKEEHHETQWQPLKQTVDDDDRLPAYSTTEIDWWLSSNTRHSDVNINVFK